MFDFSLKDSRTVNGAVCEHPPGGISIGGRQLEILYHVIGMHKSSSFVTSFIIVFTW